jgi:hypothetical protein
MKELNYKMQELEANKFKDAINKEEYHNAYSIFQNNPTLTLALPISYIHKGYWNILQNVGDKESDEFLEACERAMNDGEKNKSIRQLKLEKMVFSSKVN